MKSASRVRIMLVERSRCYFWPQVLDRYNKQLRHLQESNRQSASPASELNQPAAIYQHDTNLPSFLSTDKPPEPKFDEARVALPQSIGHPPLSTQAEKETAKPRTKSQTAKTPTGKAKAKGQMGKQTDDERTVAAQTRHQTAANDTTNKRAASTPTPKKLTTRNVRSTSIQSRRRSLNRKHAKRGLSRKQKRQ